MKTKIAAFKTEYGSHIILENDSRDYSRTTEWVEVDLPDLPKNEIKIIITEVQKKENKIDDLMGKLDRANGDPARSQNEHYLHGYGSQVANEAVLDEITEF